LAALANFFAGIFLAFFHTQRDLRNAPGFLMASLIQFLSHYLNPAVFRAMLFGCLTNCLPLALPARLALEVAAYSAGDNDLMADSGK
jgi:hypothetical protein